ncbi:enoyl-CoA hydratase/isomerase family protein [Arthrobacter pascens]|nr:enoyl-CoA hydratase/isomerase family protein [Arthrobacter pascens]
MPVDQILSSLGPGTPGRESDLARQRSHIDWCYSAPTLNGIDERLAAIPGPWASDTRNTLRKLSPQSLRLTYDLLAWGKQRNLRDCLALEMQLTRQVIKTADFIEGVRAAVVDKDRNPAWEQSRSLQLSPDGMSIGSTESAQKWFSPSSAVTSVRRSLSLKAVQVPRDLSQEEDRQSHITASAGCLRAGAFSQRCDCSKLPDSTSLLS